MNQQVFARCHSVSPSALTGRVQFVAAIFLALFVFGASSNALADQQPNHPDPVIQIRGAVGTASCGGGYDHGVGLVDLDHGLAAGATTYDHGGFIWCETYAPYLWSERTGTSTLFKLEGEFAWEHSAYVPLGMTPDGNKVVGGVIFFDPPTNAPWMWTADNGSVEFLPLPDGYTGGNAVAISSDGRVIAGNLSGPGHPIGVSQAALWRDGSPQILPSTQLWSAVGSNPSETNVAYIAQRTHPMTSDGSIIVGAAGAPSLAPCRATEWVNGIEKQLSMGSLVVQSSVAVFVSDSGVIIGYAVLNNSRVVLLRWSTGDSDPEIFEPPNGLTIVNLSSIDSQGNAAGGALAQQFSCVSCDDPACKRRPFVWTRGNGFTIILQDGQERTYNTSTVLDVSDGGRVAAGQLTACESEGLPLLGFVWSAETGLVLINDLMKEFGQPNPQYYQATGVSRNGNRVLVVGNPPQHDAQDTADLILNLTWPSPVPTQRPQSVSPR
jgi:uncharacterized membrane protein